MTGLPDSGVMTWLRCALRDQKTNLIDGDQSAGAVRHQSGGLESLRHLAPETVEACFATAGLSLGEYTAMVFAEVMESKRRRPWCNGEARRCRRPRTRRPVGWRVSGSRVETVQQLCKRGSGRG